MSYNLLWWVLRMSGTTQFSNRLANDNGEILVNDNGEAFEV